MVITNFKAFLKLKYSISLHFLLEKSQQQNSDQIKILHLYAPFMLRWKKEHVIVEMSSYLKLFQSFVVVNLMELFDRDVSVVGEWSF